MSTNIEDSLCISFVVINAHFGTNIDITMSARLGLDAGAGSRDLPKSLIDGCRLLATGQFLVVLPSFEYVKTIRCIYYLGHDIINVNRTECRLIPSTKTKYDDFRSFSLFNT